MKLVLAPDSFKGSLSAREVADALAEGFQSVWPDVIVDKVPLADGGEGTTEALVEATGGSIKHVEVTGPMGNPVSGFLGILGDGRTAVIEMAAASGLLLVPKGQANPAIATTRGTGELIARALEAGCRRIIVGIGGSATNDGGVGMAQALGASFRDRKGCELPPGGLALADLEEIDLSGLDPRLKGVDIVVACDVNNPLVGPRGASVVFGPQKGATPAMVERLDDALRHLARKIHEQLGIDVTDMPGAGAAGGLGAGLVAFLNARLLSGISLVLDAVNFRKRLVGADLVITGEGLIDEQTAYGKVPSGVLDAARAGGVPVIAVAGGVRGDVQIFRAAGFAGVIDCTPRPMTLEEATKAAREHVVQAARTIAHLLETGKAL